MNRIHPIRRLAGILAGLAGALLAFTAASPAAFATPAAFAERVPPPGDYGGTVEAPPQVHAIVTSGMPGWQITLIAVAAAVIAAAVAVILDRAWAARRHLTAPTTRPSHTGTVAARQPVTAARPRHAAMPRHPSGLQAADGT